MPHSEPAASTDHHDPPSPLPMRPPDNRPQAPTIAPRALQATELPLHPLHPAKRSPFAPRSLIVHALNKLTVNVRLLLVPVLAEVFPEHYQAEEFRSGIGGEALR